MAEPWRSPGTCADCGNDAYIRMGGGDAAEEMLCAHCYAERAQAGKIPREADLPHRALPRIRPQ